MPRRSTGLWSYPPAAGGSPPAPPPVLVVVGELRPVGYVCYVADASGEFIGELSGQLESVTWAADGYGMASMTLPSSVLLGSAALLEFGNRVLIEFDNGMAPWGGLIDVPRESSVSWVRAQFYEAGYLFNWRLTPPAVAFTGFGELPAARVLGRLVAQSGLDIDVAGPAGEPGDPVGVEFYYETLAAAASTLRGLDARLHWFVQPRPSDVGRVSFVLQTFRGHAADRTQQAVLVQGHNLVGGTVLEQGPIFNEILVAPGDTDLKAGGPVFAATHAGSRQRYDLRQQLVVLSDVTEADSPGRALAHAKARLAAYSRPRLRAQGVCLDMEPGRYREFGIGSLVQVETAAPAAGSMALTVIGMEFRPNEGVLSLVFDDGDRVEDTV